MLYHLLYPLREVFFGFNLLGYITFRSAAAAVTALIISLFIGPFIIQKIKDWNIGEEIREDGPQSHLKKSGTPTMGGIIVLCSVIVPIFLFGRWDNLYLQLVTLSTIWMGLVGFIDDYLKVIRKYPKGLIAKYKLLGQVVLGLIVGLMVTMAPEYEGIRWYSSVPFFKNLMINFGWFYIPMVVFVIAGTSNAVNITDGLDGLAIGLTGIAALAWAGMSYVMGRVDFSNYLSQLYLNGAGELTVYCFALIGACLGFLWYNAHPAQIFMGDTGALALGGAMGTLAVLLKQELLLILVGGVFVMEILSVMIQVTSFKLRGKRVFKMAPIHHHFELLGWSESKVVVRFWILGILLALLSLGTFKVR